MSINTEPTDDEVVIVKLTSGDIVVGTLEGVLDDGDGLFVGNPLVLTSTAGYILLTDFTPFVTQQHERPIVTINPATIVYFEHVGKSFAAYYHTAVQYRDVIRGDISSILDKSHKLIQASLDTALAERAAEQQKSAEAAGMSISDFLQTPIADALGIQSDSSDEQSPAQKDDKIVDFAKVLSNALKDKDSLN